MAKKLLMALAAVLVVAGGVAALSAFEAHIINVTATIENALTVSPDPLAFGTVFPQEYFTKPLTVELSTSFKAQDRINDVEYKIVQKPKPLPDGGGYYLDLCRFLSKLPENESGDVGEPSYYNPTATPVCAIREPAGGIKGKLANYEGNRDISDIWTIDLKVPPVKDYVGQDWPTSCADWVVPTNSAVYGCDLWVEVTGFTKDGVPVTP